MLTMYVFAKLSQCLFRSEPRVPPNRLGETVKGADRMNDERADGTIDLSAVTCLAGLRLGDVVLVEQQWECTSQDRTQRIDQVGAVKRVLIRSLLVQLQAANCLANDPRRHLHIAEVLPG